MQSGKRLCLAVFLMAMLICPAAAKDPAGDPSLVVKLLAPKGLSAKRGEVHLYRVPLPTGSSYRARGSRFLPSENAPGPDATAKVSRGRAAFADLKAGIWRVVAIVPGCARAETEVRWAAGLPPLLVELKLDATAILKGRVLLGDDEPLTGVRVSATARGTSFGPSSPTRHFHAETDKDGRYRMEGLAPGLYDLWTQRSGGLVFGGPVIRVPNVGRIDLHLTNGAIIWGRVTAKDSGKPVAGAVVTMTGGSFGMGNPDQVSARAVSGPKGWYELHTCRDFMNGGPLRSTAPGFATGRLSDDGLWNLREGEKYERDFVLEREAMVKGCVTGPDGPVADALVSLWHKGNDPFGRLSRITARTSADGKWSVPGLGAGTFAIEVTAAGLGHADWGKSEVPGEREEGEIPASCRVTTASGRTETFDVELVLSDEGPRAVTVEGIVKDADGTPLALAVVTVPGSDGVLTGPDGRFRVEGRSTPGWWFGVFASKPGYDRKSVGVQPEDPSTWTGLEFALERKPVLLGKVTSSLGLPVVDAKVLIGHLVMDRRGRQSADWELVPGATVAEDGSYEVSLPTLESMQRTSGGIGGSIGNGFVVCVIARGHGPAISPPFELEMRKDTYAVNLELKAGCRIEGRVRDALKKRAVAGAPIRLRPEGGQWNFSTWPPDYPPSPGTVIEAVTGKDGRFAIADLQPGTYGIGIEMGGFAPDGCTVELPGAGPVEIELRSQHPLAGRVVDPDGKPISGAGVWLVDEDGRQWYRGDLETDSEGRYRFTKVKAGKYTVHARLEGEEHDFAPGISDPVVAGREDVRVTLPRGLVIEGRLLDAAGAPLPNVSVTAKPEDGSDHSGFDRTDDGGRFKLARLRAGTYAIDFQGPGVTVGGVAAGERLEHRLKGSLRISGRIKRQEFKALRLGHRTELEAVPVSPAPAGRITRRHVARIDPEKGTFEFLYLPAGEYRITGDFEAGFKGKPKRFKVKGNVQAKAGTEDLEIRLVFKK